MLPSRMARWWSTAPTRAQTCWVSCWTPMRGARHIGEVALVPASSPINRSGKLFYNTLFDENAACHIAFGDSYPHHRGRHRPFRGGAGSPRHEPLLPCTRT